MHFPTAVCNKSSSSATLPRDKEELESVQERGVPQRGGVWDAEKDVEDFFSSAWII